jgi:hypothetical protein
MKKLLKVVVYPFCCFLQTSSYAQGNTNSSISGSVYDKDKLTLPSFLQYTHHLVLAITTDYTVILEFQT